MISEEMNDKISLATVYNTVHAFEKKGYLKEISINSDKSYFDTNTSVHHHFYDEDTNELIDCDENDIDPVNIKKNITGKKINSVEVLAVSYTHLRAHETVLDLVCRLLLEKKGYLKEISINSNKSYFDTNTSVHHHFYDEETHELIDCDENDIDPVNIKKNITGKKINSVEVLVKVASDNQNQKKFN